MRWGFVWFLLGWLSVEWINALNWAQSTGIRSQGVSYPSLTPWSARWGHGLVSDGVSLYLLGGDDFRGSNDGGGGMHNDVWRTTGSNWAVVPTVLTGEIKLLSTMTWKQIGGDRLPPTGVSYLEWLECFSRRWQGAAQCSEAEDPYGGDRRQWSPRRGHSAFYFKPDESSTENLWVIGGRAMDKVGSNAEPALKNDVWRSADGYTWRLVNPGCLFYDPQAYPGLGAEGASCNDETDCYGNSICVNELTDQRTTGTVFNSANRCRCQIFSARERHAVTVFENKIYLSGGTQNLKLTRCGDYPCNGGYEDIADDIWTSTDGEIWTKVPSMSHRFTDHKLIENGNSLFIVSFMHEPIDIFSQYTSNQSYFDAERGVVLDGLSYPRTINQMNIPGDYNDEQYVYVRNNDEIFKYVNGVGWQPISDDANNMRSKLYVWRDAPVHRLGSSIDAVDVGHMNDLGIYTIRDLTKASAQTIVDLRETHGIAQICKHLKRAEAVLNKCIIKPEYPDGYFESPDRIVIQSPMTNPYSYLRGSIDANQVVATPVATTPHLIYGADGCQQAELLEEQRPDLNLVPIYQSDADRGYVPDLTCRWGFSHRTNVGAINYRNRLYVIGGVESVRADDLVYQEQGDTWYRDDTIPSTLISMKPENKTSDTEFLFQCDEAGCIFEYQIYQVDETTDKLLLLEWTRTNGSIDLITWLDEGPGSGFYQLQVRAIDPAGNTDDVFDEGRNQLTWIYVPLIPIGLVLGILFGFLMIGVAVYLEIKRRKKKKALERYALKRMRRKFKGMQKKTQKEDDTKKHKKKKTKKEGKSEDKKKTKKKTTKTKEPSKKNA